jgi:hypothetical protein
VRAHSCLTRVARSVMDTASCSSHSVSVQYFASFMYVTTFVCIAYELSKKEQKVRAIAWRVRASVRHTHFALRLARLRSR